MHINNHTSSQFSSVKVMTRFLPLDLSFMNSSISSSSSAAVFFVAVTVLSAMLGTRERNLTGAYLIKEQPRSTGKGDSFLVFYVMRNGSTRENQNGAHVFSLLGFAGHYIWHPISFRHMYGERVETEYFKPVPMWGIHTIEWIRELRYSVRCLASAILKQINLKETVWNGCSIANQLFHSWNGFLKIYTSQMWYLLKILRGERNRDLRVVSLMTSVVCYSRVLQLYM